MFKDGFDGVFILELLLGLYDVLYDGSDTIYNVLFFGYVVWLNYGIKYETMLVLLLDLNMGSSMGFWLDLFLDLMLVLNMDLIMGSCFDYFMYSNI